MIGRGLAAGVLILLAVAGAAGAGDLTIADVMISEGDFGTQKADVFVQLSGLPDGIVTVDFTTEDGSATGGKDYLPVAGMLVFMTSPEVQKISVPIVSDLDVEPDEMFSVLLSNPVNAVILDDEAIVTILNDDAVAEPSIDDAIVTEGDAGTVSALFDVRLAAPVGMPVTVHYNTVDLTATAGEDYRATSGDVVFMPGEVHRTVAIDVFGDTLVEGDEAFLVQISDNGNLLDSAEGTIVDDDQQAGLAIGSAGVFEGDEGPTEAMFTVTLSGGAPNTVTVNYATRDGSATAASGDYASASGTLTFAPGDTMKRVIVEVIGDTMFEPDETFFVDLSAPDGAQIVDGQGEGTILNDDQESASLSISDASVLEGAAGRAVATFTVMLSRPPDGTGGGVTVDFATRDGTATVADGDYLPASGTLTFAPGQTAIGLDVEVIDDARVEPDEFFFVDLSNPQGATIADGEGRGTILNDDQVRPSISIDDVSVVEGDAGRTVAGFTVMLSQPTEATVSVDFATLDGSATAADGDFLPNQGTLTFAPGDTALPLAVEVIGDTRVEPDETFSVELTNPQGATIADAQGAGTILNDDQQPSRIRFVEVPRVAESAGTAAVSVERFGGSARPARVTLTAVSGTATAGEDFVVVSRVVSWAAREVGRKVVALEIIDDSLEEDDETVLLRLSGPVDSTLADPRSRALVIVDDDAPMALAAVGDTDVASRAGAEIELAVRATRGDGAAVEGATVIWGLEGDAELLGEARVVTDDGGVAGQQVRLGGTAGEVVVAARLENADADVAFTVTVAAALADAVDPARDPGGAAVAQALDQSCGAATGDLGELCDYLTALDDSDQEAAITELTPEEAAAQAEVSLGAQKTQLANIGSRLAALRGGAVQGAVTRLAMSIQGQPFDLGGVLTARAWRRDDHRLAERLDSALASALAGGLAAAGQEAEGESPPPEAPSGARPSGAPRWGIFVNGRISIGDRPTTALETGFDFETLGLTAGADYRLSDRWVVGGALGYLDTDTDLAADGGRLDARGTSLSAYASYSRDRFYLDGVLGYGRTSYDSVRNVDLPQPFQGQRRFIARGSPDGSQLSARLGGGYDAQIEAWTVGGFGSLSWIDSTIDAYLERDAGPFNLALADQDVESLLSELGAEVAYAASRSWGVLRPTLRLAYLHEHEDDARLIRARFLDDLTATEFAIPTEEPDRDFFNLTAGLTATLARGRTLYLIYDTDLERDDLDVYTFTFGARFEL